ncbi:MAG: 50S ribosomal protein L24 [Bradymonadia bacterium]
MHIKTNDKVQVTAGKEKGKIGTVIRVDHRRNRVYVEGLNIVKRHQRQNVANEESGIIEKEAGIHASNVLVYSEEAGRGVRLGYRYEGKEGALFASKKEALASFGGQQDGTIKKVRYCARTGEVFR